jgi:hypothetical protein
MLQVIMLYKILLYPCTCFCLTARCAGEYCCFVFERSRFQISAMTWPVLSSFAGCASTSLP